MNPRCRRFLFEEEPGLACRQRPVNDEVRDVRIVVRDDGDHGLGIFRMVGDFDTGQLSLQLLGHLVPHRNFRTDVDEYLVHAFDLGSTAVFERRAIGGGSAARTSKKNGCCKCAHRDLLKQ